jgi:hypothetical protein
MLYKRLVAAVVLGLGMAGVVGDGARGNHRRTKEVMAAAAAAFTSSKAMLGPSGDVGVQSNVADRTS